MIVTSARKATPLAITAAVIHAILLAALVPPLSDAAIAAHQRTAVQLVLLASALIPAICALLVGAAAVGDDLHARTTWIWLAGAVSRTRWVTSRAVGMLLPLAALVGVNTLVGIAVLRLRDISLPIAHFGLIGGAAFAEAAILAALAMAISTRARPLFAAACALGIGICGHLAAEYAGMAATVPGLDMVGRIAYVCLPNLDRFDVDAVVLHDLPIRASALAGTAAYAAAWVVALIAAAAISVERQDVE